MTKGLHRWSVSVVVPQEFNVYEVIAPSADEAQVQAEKLAVMDGACCPVAEPARMMFESQHLHMLAAPDMKEC